MAQFPLSDLLTGVKRLFVGLQGKKTDGTYTELKVTDSGELKTVPGGKYYRLAAEAKPTVADGVQNGNTLLLVDTGQVFVYYSGQWREQ